MLSIPRCNAGCNLLRAEFIGSDRCAISGFTAISQTPVLALCRTLLAAGFDPRQPLHVCRGDKVALYVRSIGEAARLTVKDDRLGRTRFARWQDRAASDAGAPPIASLTWGATGGRR